MSDQLGLMADRVFLRLAGARLLFEGGGDPSHAVPQLRSPDRFPVDAEGARDCAFPLPAMEEQKGAGAIEFTRALLPPFPLAEADNILPRQGERYWLHTQSETWVISLSVYVP